MLTPPRHLLDVVATRREPRSKVLKRIRLGAVTPGTWYVLQRNVANIVPLVLAPFPKQYFPILSLKVLLSLTAIFMPRMVGQMFIGFTSINVFTSLEQNHPECIVEVRYNPRVNLIAVDNCNGMTTRDYSGGTSSVVFMYVRLNPLSTCHFKCDQGYR